MRPELGRGGWPTLDPLKPLGHTFCGPGALYRTGPSLRFCFMQGWGLLSPEYRPHRRGGACPARHSALATRHSSLATSVRWFGWLVTRHSSLATSARWFGRLLARLPRAPFARGHSPLLFGIPSNGNGFVQNCKGRAPGDDFILPRLPYP